MEQWNKELEERILKKSKFTLTLKIIRIILILFLVHMFYKLILEQVVQYFNDSQENHYFSTLAIEWTNPNVYGSFNLKEEPISFFGTKVISYDLFKRVGNEQFVIGESEVTKPLFFDPFRKISLIPGEERLSDIAISMPEDPRTGSELKIDTNPKTWETLEILPEGTVAELSFTTSSFMNAKELVTKLEKYDLHILWMPLYTGEFKEYEPFSYSTGIPASLHVYSVIGLKGGKDHDGFYRVGYESLYITKDDLKENEQLMLKNMKEILHKPEDYYKHFLGLPHLEEQYNYIVENGFTVYGAVVTGPTKELLKLKDEPLIQGVQLGEVELWNWQLYE